MSGKFLVVFVGALVALAVAPVAMKFIPAKAA